MIGGAYLCYEGFEKIAHKFKHDAAEDAHRAEHLQALANPTVDLLAIEKEKIQGAIRTDFILSAEIVVIALAARGRSAIFTRPSRSRVDETTTGGSVSCKESVRNGDSGSQIVSDRVLGSEWRSLGRAVAPTE